MAADENGLPYGADWTTDPINSFTTGFQRIISVGMD